MPLLFVFIGVGLPILFAGIWIAGYTFRIVFDHTLGAMIIRTGIGPLTYRTRRFSKAQVQSVRASELPHEQWHGLWEVALRIIQGVSESSATYLADRVSAFKRKRKAGPV